MVRKCFTLPLTACKQLADLSDRTGLNQSQLVRCALSALIKTTPPQTDIEDELSVAIG